MPSVVEQRAYRFAARHQAALNIIGWVCFGLVCADYARFIELPDLVTLPAAVAGVLMGARYVLWDGVIKPRFEKSEESKALSSD